MTHEEEEYLADPDFLAKAVIFDDQLGRMVSVEVAYGFEPRRGQAGKLILCNGIREKQLLFEATTLEIIPFHRKRPFGSQKPGAKPRRSYRPSASPVS